MIMSSEATKEPRRPAWPEAELVAGLACGDGRAAAAFVDQAHDAVFAFARRCADDPDLCRDWTHDALLRMMDDVRGGAFEYRRPGAFWAWFRLRARGLVLEARRKEALHRRRERPGPEGDAPERPARDDPARDAEEAEAAAAVTACLEAMENRDQARALALRAVDDLPYDDIARIMDAPLNTVRAWIRRGRVALRRCLARRLDWPQPDEES